VFLDDANDYKLNISIRPEELFKIGSFSVTNGMITTLIAVVLCALLFAYLCSRPQLKPSRKQAVGEFIIESLLGQVENSLGRKTGRSLFPLLATFFLFIIFANWFSLIPGIGTIGITKGQITADSSTTVNLATAKWALTTADTTLGGEALLTNTPLKILSVNGSNATVQEVNREWSSGTEPEVDGPQGSLPLSALSPAKRVKILIPFFRAPNADINMTLSMALISIFLVEFLTIRAHGLRGWLKEFFPKPSLYWLGPIEIVSHLSRVISLTFRLYGNVFAGEVLLSVILILAGPIVIVFIGLEVFFGFIQALVFFLLSTAYFNLGIIGQGEGHSEEHAEGGADTHALQEAGAAH
jgi:F-type H+-transporting ATPase subunit a